MSAPVIFWFRQDLRLADNPGLCEAANAGSVIPIYILDEQNAQEWAMGGASLWWLHHALDNLNQSLNGKLIILKGDATELVPHISKETGAQAVLWNRCYEPWRIARDKAIKSSLKENSDIRVESFNASLLWEPWTVSKDDGNPYKVFTPYYRNGCLKATPPREPLDKPDLTFAQHTYQGETLESLGLIPDITWYKQMEQEWTPSEAGAKQRLGHFLNHGLKLYKKGRDEPAQEATSKLSSYLHFGQISPNTAWYSALEAAAAAQKEDENLDCFLSELGWREFSYYLLYHQPEIIWNNLQEKFNRFPWKAQQSKELEAWQKGLTGYPIVDAGMRELWQTGYMHNRVRMIVGSFLVKNLLHHWHLGEQWFWDTLLDADLASNSASWQWIAGCGADAAPYFRIFNPVLQGEKFDKHGDYIRTYIPELKHLPDKYIHKPWEASDTVLKDAHLTLGKDYPKPIVDLKASRQRALDALSSIKE
jgi:deoxyribodipyrimidine photo-lyase